MTKMEEMIHEALGHSCSDEQRLLWDDNRAEQRLGICCMMCGKRWKVAFKDVKVEWDMMPRPYRNMLDDARLKVDLLNLFNNGVVVVLSERSL